MNGGFRKNLEKNWQRLAVLAAGALVLLLLAVWWNGREADNSPSQSPAETAEIAPEPLADTPLGNTMREMFDKGDYQTTLPDKLIQERPKQQTSNMPEWLALLILYALVAAGLFTIALFLWVLVTGHTSIRPRRKQTQALRKKRPVAATPVHALIQQATFEDAETAATAGNYGEAVRILLGTALISLSRQELVLIRPWMTGREIVNGATIASHASTALRHLVTTVEAFAFAGQDIDRSTYETCLNHHQILMKLTKGAK